ncbi:hypothetical protein PoB_006480500 [Plakobranchus ocellatus]|uniref:Uncharacterized protein n=1 Tax=Plakobranchus ocellatus TaxID=259542 RepID=A0AAV4D2K7_9GAST|nr:hypothetical protein PoB_006480500 [Plakobranchus ocellatus]
MYLFKRGHCSHNGGVGGTVDSEFVLRSARIIPSWVQTPLPALWSHGRSEGLRSPCYGLAILENQTNNRNSLRTCDNLCRALATSSLQPKPWPDNGHTV